jgi:hypothetical protein
MFVLESIIKHLIMSWKPVGENAEKPLSNELLWTALALQAMETEGQTLIHCRYVSKKKYRNGGWVNILPTTYLINADTGERLTLVQAMDIPVSPDRHVFGRAGEWKSFTLLFPRIPAFWKRFHFVEVAGVGGFSVRDMIRNEKGVYHLVLK